MLSFALLALLLYPDGHYKVLDLGGGLTNSECIAAEKRAETQLPETLSIAQLVAVECKKNIAL